MFPLRSELRKKNFARTSVQLCSNFGPTSLEVREVRTSHGNIFSVPTVHEHTWLQVDGSAWHCQWQQCCYATTAPHTGRTANKCTSGQNASAFTRGQGRWAACSSAEYKFQCRQFSAMQSHSVCCTMWDSSRHCAGLVLAQDSSLQ